MKERKKKNESKRNIKFNILENRKKPGTMRKCIKNNEIVSFMIKTFQPMKKNKKLLPEGECEIHPVLIVTMCCDAVNGKVLKRIFAGKKII
jgi:hypothetical protein